jgi:hypothetical protein
MAEKVEERKLSGVKETEQQKIWQVDSDSRMLSDF